MLHRSVQVPQKRERDAALDTEQPRTPAQKTAKVGESADPATNPMSSNQTPDMPEGHARPDSATVPPSPSLESFLKFKKKRDDTAPPNTGTERKGGAKRKAKVRFDNTENAGPGPVPWEDLSSYKTTSSEDAAQPKARAKGKGNPTATDDDSHNENATKPGPEEEDRAYSSTSSEDTSRLQEHTGDLFAAPDDTVLVHACNTQGSWGAGIAKEFRKRYPEAFRVYEEHCLVSHHPKKDPVPTSTCFLIPPIETKVGARRHWIACLFTSAKFGGNKESQERILANTVPAFRDLLAQLHHHSREGIGPAVQEIRMCRINSGLFSVKWHHTKIVLQAVLASDPGDLKVHVYSLPTSPSKSDTVRRGQTTLQSFIRRH